MSQFILSDSELVRIYNRLLTLEQEVCDLRNTCFAECSAADAEGCVDIDIDKVLVLSAVDVATTTYYIGTVGENDILDARITVSVGSRSSNDMPFRLIALIGGDEIPLVESKVEAGYLSCIIDSPTISGTAILSLETIAGDCPPEGLKINISGISCGDVSELCPAPPAHCSVFQYGSVTACSLFE